MIAKNILFFLVLTFFFLGCSKDNPVKPPEQNSTGKVLLKIDKANAPQNIVVVTATLTRDNFPSITASLNLLSDTTADLTLNSVPVGEWLLTVEAKDSAGEIKYSGETNVTIMESMITQVSLTLMPTGTGMGSIYIFVNWGISGNWQDYQNNPILAPSGSYWDFQGVHQPKILYENNQYKMWFNGLANGSASNVGYAVSSNGINWTRPFNNPVLSPGNYSSWDALATIAGAIIHETNGYKMYYVGWSNQNGNWHIGLATSIDGISWTKYPNPVMYGTSGWEYQIIPASILKIDNTYYLYYHGRNYPSYNIGLAFSNDGISWTKYSQNPILSPTASWEGTGVFHPGIIRENGIFKMVYMNSVGTAFGFATSSDGKSWTKQSNQPFFKKENTYNNWANGSIAYPCYIKVSNEYRIYYSGYSSNEDKYKIGFMRKF